MKENKKLEFRFYSDIVDFLNEADTLTDVCNGAVVIIYSKTKENYSYILEVKYPKIKDKKWVCEDCKFREQNGDDPFLDYKCGFDENKYPCVAYCPFKSKV